MNSRGRKPTGKRHYNPKPRRGDTTMANTFTQIILHTTFHVKVDCHISTSDLPRLYAYIQGIIKNEGGVMLAAGGTTNHIHLLLTQPKTITLSNYMMKIKANSSRWLKELGSQYRAFAWQDGYGAFSVSASKVRTVAQYIANQEEHHKKKTFQQEMEEFQAAYMLDGSTAPAGLE